MTVVTATTVAAFLLCAGAEVATADDAVTRVVPLTSLASREAAQSLVSAAVATGVQALLVPVSLFAEPPAVLADVVSSARAQGLRVVASVDVTLAAGANELPAARDHVIYTHPEWLMVPRELALELARMDVHSPDYAGRLARWTRANAETASGLYLSPVHRDAAAFVANAVRGLVERYGFDGVQFDTARYPSGDFDYSRLTLGALREEIRVGLPPDERRRMDRIEAFDPLAYATEFPEAWRRFRQTQLTALVVRVRTAVKAVKPDAVVSAVVGSDPSKSLSEHLQDWATWIDNRFVDAVTTDERSVTAIRSNSSGTR